MNVANDGGVNVGAGDIVCPSSVDFGLWQTRLVLDGRKLAEHYELAYV